MKRTLVGLLVVVSMFGCAAEDDSASLGVQSLDVDLSLAASGPQVRTLNDFLANHGYYPNARLADMYPSWRPPIRSRPLPGCVTTSPGLAATPRV